MTLFHKQYRVESARKKGWDYSTPADYYVTICVLDKEQVFGNVIDGNMVLNEVGVVVKECWEELEMMFKHIKLHDFIIMPDHMHGIVRIVKQDAKGLSSIVGAFKSLSTRKVNIASSTLGNKLWQERYYDRIIRDEKAFFFVTEYIRNNPLCNDPVIKEMEWYDLLLEKQKREKIAKTL